MKTTTLFISGPAHGREIEIPVDSAGIPFQYTFRSVIPANRSFRLQITSDDLRSVMPEIQHTLYLPVAAEAGPVYRWFMHTRNPPKPLIWECVYDLTEFLGGKGNREDWVRSNPSGSVVGGSAAKVRSLFDLIPGLDHTVKNHRCPGCEQGLDLYADTVAIRSYPDKKVYDIITHLNDVHKYSFEQIAEHLRKLPVDLTVNEGR